MSKKRQFWIFKKRNYLVMQPLITQLPEVWTQETMQLRTVCANYKYP